MADQIKADQTVNVKGQICPYTFVRSKLAIEKMGLGQVLEIVTDNRPASENIPRSMENEGQKVLRIVQSADKEWHIFVRKDKYTRKGER